MLALRMQRHDLCQDFPLWLAEKYRTTFSVDRYDKRNRVWLEFLNLWSGGPPSLFLYWSFPINKMPNCRLFVLFYFYFISFACYWEMNNKYMPNRQGCHNSGEQITAAGNRAYSGPRLRIYQTSFTTRMQCALHRITPHCFARVLKFCWVIVNPNLRKVLVMPNIGFPIQFYH